MAFIINLLFGYFAFSVYDNKYGKTSYWTSLLILAPFFIWWVLLIGGQYFVGTDYGSYLSIFDGTGNLWLYELKGEYLFYYLVSGGQALGLSGQDFFYIFAAFFALLYWKISRSITTRNHALFFFLFVAVSTLFHNQMNILRQSCAIYLITLAFISLAKNRKLSFLALILIASGFHQSSIVILIFFFFRNIRLGSYFAKVCLVAATLISFASIEPWIKEIVSSISTYAHYADSNFVESTSLINKLTKLSLFPVYFLCTNLLKKESYLSPIEMKLFQLGFLTYMLRSVFLVSSVSNRIGYFFLLTAIFPLFYYLRYLKENDRKSFWIICCYLLFIYLLKIVVFPSKEYLYSSIYPFLFN